jgi:putative hemolysin
MNPFAIAGAWSRPLEFVLGLTRLHALYRQARDRGPLESFIDVALRLLRIRVVSEGSIEAIPLDGPTIVVANHPCGAVDGLALAQAVRKRRTDVKLFANHLLLRIPELREHVIGVTVFDIGGRDAVDGVRAARRWLRAGHVLIMFPAGEVSGASSVGRGVDGEWRRGVLKLMAWTNATVVPAFLHAQNRRRFRLIGRIHPLLRTLMLPRELLALGGQSVRVSVGDAIRPARWAMLQDDASRLSYLRARTYALAGREAVQPVDAGGRALAAPEDPAALAGEISALPAETRLLESGPYEVYGAAGASIPTVVREIGRLRELTFRRVGEGTGAPRDLDAFDESYLHLFVWHPASRAVVGAYRVGLTDRLGAMTRPRVLYTRTLFRYGPQLLQQLGPAIELGRSFVRPEFQRDSNALLLLWRGIGTLVAREPRYRFLFGAVSISADYQSLTRQLIARFLSTDAFLSSLADLVRPSRPLTVGPEATRLVDSKVVTSLHDVEQLVVELERGRGLPVLLRHYLKLNAQLLGFNVDPAFGNVLDGLVLVDLLRVKPALLQRYLGREGAAALLRHHNRHLPASRAA